MPQWRDKLRALTAVAAKVTAVYLLVGGGWILFSDKTLAMLGYDVAALTRLQTAKGWLYVLITGVLLFWLVRHYTWALETSQRELVQSNRELADANRALHDLAYYDSLTGLPNGHLFRQQLALALAAWRHGRPMVAVLFVGLDGFKVVNSIAGHEAGDRLLKGVAERLRRCTPPGAVVARLGGDVFTFLLPVVNDVQAATTLVREILAVCQQPWLLDGYEFRVTASIGLACCPDDGDSVEALMKHADVAMERAKEMGRNTWRSYSPALNARALGRLYMENSLRRAVERQEFIVYYQPQIQLATGLPVGVEALVRWVDPQEGLITPDRFIPLAEENGLIVPIGTWVLRDACRQIKAWQNSGLPPVRVAVNLSARQFHLQGLRELVEAVLTEQGLAPQWLELEITESLVMQDLDYTVAVLQDLKAMGVRVALDDFGTGYSSLLHLKRLPIDVVKIDRSFVRDVPEDADDTAIVRTIITLAQSLHIAVTAEGVETEAQRDFLRRLHCDTAQGYLFSRPVPAEMAAQFLQQASRQRA